MLKGTVTPRCAGTVTCWVESATQRPMSFEGASLVRMSMPPAEVVNASRT